MGAPAPPNPPLGGSWDALKRSQSGLGAFLAALGDAWGLPGLRGQIRVHGWFSIIVFLKIQIFVFEATGCESIIEFLIF